MQYTNSPLQGCFVTDEDSNYLSALCRFDSDDHAARPPAQTPFSLPLCASFRS